MPKAAVAGTTGFERIASELVRIVAGTSTAVGLRFNEQDAFRHVMGSMVACPPYAVQLMRTQWRLLNEGMPAVAGSSTSNRQYRTVSMKLNPFRFVAACALSLLPDQRPEVPHWLALCAFCKPSVPQLNVSLACSLFVTSINERDVDHSTGELFWAMGIAARAFVATVDWDTHAEPVAVRMPHRVVVGFSPTAAAELVACAGELDDVALAVEGGQDYFAPEWTAATYRSNPDLGNRARLALARTLAAMGAAVAIDEHPERVRARVERLVAQGQEQEVASYLAGISNQQVLDQRQLASILTCLRIPFPGASDEARSHHSEPNDSSDSYQPSRKRQSTGLRTQASDSDDDPQP